MYEDRGLGFVVVDRRPDYVIPLLTPLAPGVVVVVDEVKMLEPMRRIAKTVVYRVSDDDHAHEHYNPIEFVNRLHAAAPPGIALYLGNEPGRGDLPALASWTFAALERCLALGRMAVALNFEVGVPEAADWRGPLRPVLEWLKRHGYYLGLHEYEPTLLAKPDGWHIGRWQGVPAELRPPIIITELGYAKDLNPHAGWADSGVSAVEYAKNLEWLRAYYAMWDIPACGYIIGQWHGFELDALVPLLSKPRSALLTPGAIPSNIRSSPTVTSSIVGSLRAPSQGLVLTASPVPSWDATPPDPWWPVVVGAARGYLRKDVVGITAAPANAVRLPVPFFSQTSATATLPNDCGPTAARMVIGWRLLQGIGRDAQGLRVDDVSREAGLLGAALGTVDQVIKGLLAFGVSSARVIMTASTVQSIMRGGKPVILLVNAGVLGISGSYTGPHFVVAAGRADGLLFILDPLGTMAGSWVPIERVAAAMAANVAQGNPANVCIVPDDLAP